MSLHYTAPPAAEQPNRAALGWRLFLPREWIDAPSRRQKAGMAYRSKNALALELIEEALARRLPPAPVLAARVAVWASHGYAQRQHQGARTLEWLFIEWPKDQDAPTASKLSEQRLARKGMILGTSPAASLCSLERVVRHGGRSCAMLRQNERWLQGSSRRQTSRG